VENAKKFHSFSISTMLSRPFSNVVKNCVYVLPAHSSVALYSSETSSTLFTAAISSIFAQCKPFSSRSPPCFGPLQYKINNPIRRATARSTVGYCHCGGDRHIDKPVQTLTLRAPAPRPIMPRHKPNGARPCTYTTLPPSRGYRSTGGRSFDDTTLCRRT